ncbi:MAG: hypothetical protein U0Q15_16210 [Kineosporiaceae bacterium]
MPAPASSLRRARTSAGSVTPLIAEQVPGAPRTSPTLRRGSAIVLAAGLVAGLAGCAGERTTPSPTSSTAASATPGASPSAGWVRAETPTIRADFPENWMRINDEKLGDGIAARSPAAADGSRAVVTVRILGVGVGDAQQVGASPATAAADQTISQLGERGVKGVKAVSGSVAGRPGWVLRWDQVNDRDPSKQVYRHVWGVSDLGTRQFVLVTAQAPASTFAQSKVDDVLAGVRLPLAVAPTGTPTRTPDGSGDVVIDQQKQGGPGLPDLPSQP